MSFDKTKPKTEELTWSEVQGMNDWMNEGRVYFVYFDEILIAILWLTQ